jgi:long-chain acyl-CoA synthetase
MLYERWCEIASDRRNERAVRDPGAERWWTFAELKAANERLPEEDGWMVRPRGTGVEFVLAVLAGWRRGKVVCPLEPGQVAPLVARPPPGCVHLKLTSATTGVPRLVAFTGAQLAADAENIVATMGLRSDWPNLGCISMAHSYGFSNLVLPLLLHGIPLHLVHSPLPETVRRAAASETALTLAAVPALWRAWHEAGAIPSSVRLAISAGAPLPLELEQAVFKGSGLKIHNFLGATECGGIAYDASESPRTEAACVGWPMVNVSLSVEESGCLTVQGASVGETYWPDPAMELGGGRFQTSDLVDLRRGQVYWMGRASDLINVAGRKVSPATIEQALLRHPAVRECVVFGVPGAEVERGEIIVACAATQPAATVAGLRDFALAQLANWQVPREWWLVDSLPVNARGKISRAEWRQRYQQRQHQGRGADSPRTV